MKNNVREIRCFDYVNQPYGRVRDVFRRDATSEFRAATNSAVLRAQSVAAALHVDVGGIGIKADIEVRVTDVEEKIEANSSPSTRLQLEWKAATMPGLFPVMNAELSVYPLTATETQLDFLAHYEPPFGVVGKAMNAVACYRIAEVSVHQFVVEVAEHLRQTLAQTATGKIPSSNS